MLPPIGPALEPGESSGQSKSHKPSHGRIKRSETVAEAKAKDKTERRCR